MKQEADHAQRESPERAEPGRTNGVAEPRPIDILELLSKAKEEYQRVRRRTHTTFSFFLVLTFLTWSLIVIADYKHMNLDHRPE